MIILALVALLLLSGAAAAVNGYDFSRHVIGGGGGHSQSGAYTLDGSVGQAVAGRVSQTPYDQCAGFWCGLGRYHVYLPLVLREP